MKRILARNLAMAAALAVLAATAGTWPAAAADTKPDPAAAATAAAADLEPAALGALDKMGAYLQTLSAIEVEAVTQREDVLETGLKVQFQGTVKLVARKPDRLRIDVLSDRQDRQYFYDGKQFTLWARRVGYWAVAPAPPTIGELTVALQEKFGIEMPFVDLFRWGTPAADKSAITLAMDIGPSKVGDDPCEHYVFRQEGLDWQIWIQNGNAPLPRKLVLTTTTDEARPQFQAIYTWNTAPTINDADFTFVPPADAQRIVFETGASNKEK